MARRPVIGISAYARTGNPPGFAVPCGYVDAVRRAGGSPIALPPGDHDPAHYLDLVDGLILAGGGDIDPKSYGGSDHATLYSMCPERDAFELALIHAVLKRRDRPVLCICRGMQILNIALGGDLFADIPDAVVDSMPHRKLENRPTPLDHRATVTAGSRIAGILGATDVVVRSWHHQALREVGRDLDIVARAEDGIIEAIEHRTHPWCMAVQWHPELQPDDPIQQRLFTALIDEAHKAASGDETAGAEGDVEGSRRAS